MKILVAGGFGFVGGRVAQALAHAGHTPVLGSRVKRDSPHWLSQGEVRILDWASEASLRAACEGVDAVVHAAGMNAAECMAKPVAALQANGVQSARLVAAAVAAGARRFFYFSTAHVYGSPLAGEIDETSCPRNLHPYATSHLAGEHALLHALAQGAIRGSALRLSNGFGAPAHAAADCWDLLVNDLCRQALTQRKLVLRSSGAQLRDFIALSTVCQDVHALLSAPEDSLPAILNLASGQAISVADMAGIIAERCAVTLGFEPKIEFGSRMEAAAPLKIGSLHAEALGLEPALGLVAEIDALLAFCQRLHDKGGN